VIARLNRHVDTGGLPPVEPRSDGEDDSLLRWRLVDALWHDEA
jgi:hypothetical protein